MIRKKAVSWKLASKNGRCSGCLLELPKLDMVQFYVILCPSVMIYLQMY